MEKHLNLVNEAAFLKTNKENTHRLASHSGLGHVWQTALIVVAVVLAGTALADAPADNAHPGNASTPTRQPAAHTSTKAFKPLPVQAVQFTGVSGRSVTAEQLQDLEISLFVEITSAGLLYHEPQDNKPQTKVRIGDIGQNLPTFLDITALRALAKATSRAYSDLGIGAVRVSIMSDAVARLRKDNSDGILVISVTEGQVARVGTLSRRIGKDPSTPDQEQDSPKALHERIRRTSPVQPGDPLDVSKVDDHVARLNRHPGRHVGAEVRPGQKSGEIELDYLIAELKPWQIYFQLDNTGTENTEELRERFGFRHYNLTGADDILAIDYVTGNFKDVHYILGSYDFVIPGWEQGRLKPFAGWSVYEGSELGVFNSGFRGESYQIGAEFRTTILQKRRLFLDLLAGARYQNVGAENDLAGTDGESGFALPWVGLKLDSKGRHRQGSAGVTLELGFAGEDKSELELLGRAEVDDAWAVLRYDFSGSVYLEPMFDSYFAGRPVHEIYASIRGQVVPGGQRLTPSFMYPVGGFYSVRGYPESFASGDSTIVASIEYRLHLRDLLFADNQTTLPSWDLIARGFLDGGHASYNDALSFEEDITFISLGIGLDLKFLRNFQCRLDVGFPMNSVDNGSEQVKSGDARVHFSVGASF